MSEQPTEAAKRQMKLLNTIMSTLSTTQDASFIEVIGALECAKQQITLMAFGLVKPQDQPPAGGQN